MSLRRYTFPDPSAAADAAARHVMNLLEEVLSAQNSATMAISGGSTPKLMFDRLAASEFPREKVHLFWVDERCVPPGDEQSNFRLASEHLIRPAQIPQRNTHRVLGELEPQAAAKRYVEEITAFFGLNAGELPQFDVLHLGMGPDAHMASLFPVQPLIEDRESIAAPVYVEKFKQWRVTLLPGVLLAAKHTVFLVAGEDKADSLRAVYQDEYDPKRYPAQMAARHGGDVTWFLDQAAARLID